VLLLRELVARLLAWVELWQGLVSVELVHCERWARADLVGGGRRGKEVER
jgi:hypothetical protein